MYFSSFTNDLLYEEQTEHKQKQKKPQNKSQVNSKQIVQHLIHRRASTRRVKALENQTSCQRDGGNPRARKLSLGSAISSRNPKKEKTKGSFFPEAPPPPRHRHLLSDVCVVARASGKRVGAQRKRLSQRWKRARLTLPIFYFFLVCLFLKCVSDDILVNFFHWKTV